MGDEVVAYVLSPSHLSGGSIELTEYGEELYRRQKLTVGSLLFVDDEDAKHVILVTNAKHENLLFEEESVYQALRKKRLIEEELVGADVSHVVMDFMLVGEIFEGRLDRPQRPAFPGAPVRLLKADDRDVLFENYVRKEIYENPELKEVFKFGTISGSRGLKGLAIRPRINMHLGIVGTTGSGKSFTAGAIIEKLAAYKYLSEKDVSIFVFDVHNEYTNAFDTDQELEIAGEVVSRSVIRNVTVISIEGENPIKLRFTMDEEPLFTSSEMVELVRTIYGSVSGGAYVSLLERLFERPEAFEILDSLAYEDAEKVKGELFSIIREETEYSRASKDAAKRALSNFVDAIKNYVREDGVGPDEIVKYAEEGHLVIFDLGKGAENVSTTIKDLIISYVLRILYKKLANKYRRTDKRLVFVIDEAQTFIPGRGYESGAALTKSIVRKIASQGRKFGFSLVLISQRPAFMDQHVFSLVNSLIVHRTAFGDAEAIRKTFGLPPSMTNVFSNLRTGEAFVFGQLFEIPFKIRIVKGEDRQIYEERKTRAIPVIFRLSSVGRPSSSRRRSS